MAKFETACCPLCHQTVGALRSGVRLPPLKAALLDRIRAAGDPGITSAELIASDIYRDRRAVQPTTIKAHILQINGDSGWRIASDSRRWTLVRG